MIFKFRNKLKIYEEMLKEIGFIDCEKGWHLYAQEQTSMPLDLKYDKLQPTSMIQTDHRGNRMVQVFMPRRRIHAIPTFEDGRFVINIHEDKSHETRKRTHVSVKDNENIRIVFSKLKSIRWKYLFSFPQHFSFILGIIKRPHRLR